MILFFDTETTGKLDFKRRSDAPGQPRLVQLAMILCADDGKELSSANVTIKPDGFEIPKEASDIHGITTWDALAFGIDISLAVGMFRSLRNSSSLMVGHNIDFDESIMDGELWRHFHRDATWGTLKESFCTMRAMTDVCKLPGNYGDYKWPKLQEAYRHAFGNPFDDAHDALADVRACKEIYFWHRNHTSK